MEIENKYFNLLNLLVHDKRTKVNGMICALEIKSMLVNGLCISYNAYFHNDYRELFVEDFEKGNVVFLAPFSVNYRVQEFEEMAKTHRERIKEFFGEKFRKDMIMEISEEERQREIMEWKKPRDALFNWDMKFAHDKKEEQ